MSTKAEVRNRAAGLLGRHRLGQSINDDLKTRLDEAYTVVYAALKVEQLTTWASGASATIPNSVAPHMAALMALDATDDIKVSDALMLRILRKVNAALPAIRKAVTPQFESMDDPEDF
jgi:hypothetical protein